MPTPRILPVVVAPMLALAAALPAVAGSPTLIEVDSTSALPEVPGACTLKSALRAAAFRLPSGTCAVPPPGVAPIIRLPAGATIVLDDVNNVRADGSFGTSSFVLAWADGPGLEIEGRGATVRRGFSGCQRNASPAREVDFGFLFGGAITTAIAIRDLTLENFCNVSTLSGGAVAVQGAPRVTLDRVRLVGNVSAGSGGGARLQAGRVVVTDSVFNGNQITGPIGVGLALLAAEDAVAEGAPSGIVVARNTFTGQSLHPDAAPDINGTTVRVIPRTRADIDLNTLSGNSGGRYAGLSVVPAGGTSPRVAVRQNTFVGNVGTLTGASLQVGGATGILLLNNLLLSAANGCDGFANQFQFVGANLSNDASCGGWIQVAGSGVVAPTLTNSGGLVPTHRLVAGSPAIDAATACALPGEAPEGQDVRGATRPLDGDNSGTAECDAGATEFVRNVAPVLTAPVTATTATGTSLAFTLGAGNPIRVADADARGLPLEVELSVASGTIRFGTEDGLACSGGGGVGGAIRRCRGSLAAFNAGLEGARFDPPPGFSGTVQLTIAVTDLGNGGDDGVARTDQRNVPITVQAQAAVLSITPSPVDFGSVAEGQSATRVITLTNAGNQALQLSSIALLGGGDFTITADGCARGAPGLAPGIPCSVTVAFQPQGDGARQASLVVQSNAPSSPDLVLLDGRGLAEVVFRAGFEPND